MSLEADPANDCGNDQSSRAHFINNVLETICMSETIRQNA